MEVPMDAEMTPQLWWLATVDLPLLGGLFWLFWRSRVEGDAALAEARRAADASGAQLRDALAAFKLEVARGYASMAYINDLERRLVAHLLRIEAKLDRPRAACGEVA
jgi:hypothetical protein